MVISRINDDEIYYFDFLSGDSVWDYLCDKYFRWYVYNKMLNILDRLKFYCIMIIYNFLRRYLNVCRNLYFEERKKI